MEPRAGNPVGKELHLRMDHMEEVRVVAHALSSDVRLRILAMIGATSMNVNEIARELGAPVSTTALNIQVLERAGFVEYHFPPADVPLNRVDFLELSFEACSETLGHNNRWPSSIYVEINGQRLGVWHCEGDFGGRRGQWSPPWWDATSTQFGQLKTWRVDQHQSTKIGHGRMQKLRHAAREDLATPSLTEP